MDNKQREKVIDSLVQYIEKITNKKRPTKEEVVTLPEVVKALKSFTEF